VGGIALLRAALRSPEAFSAIILLDPVLFPPSFIRFYQAAHALHLAHKIHPLVSVAKRRRRVFKNREMILRGYRNKSVFRYFSDKALESYVRGITCPRNDGSYELCYSPEWEVQIYITGVWRDMELWRGLKNLQVPLLILRGAETDAFFESSAKLVKKKLPTAEVISIPNTTHLVPLEDPDAVSDEIRKFLSA
jgi:pimeloyl-ACP methyl ester carboxylesterase